MREKHISLFILGLLLTGYGLWASPMTLVFPMWIFAHLWRDKLRRLLAGIPLFLSFMGSGLFFGLLTECFAILQNINKPPSERILLNPNPLADLTLALFYYSLLILTWYLLLRRISFPLWAVFVLTGILGIVTEQMGAIMVGIFVSPFGILMAILIACVYGIFPMLTCVVNQPKFEALGRRMPGPGHYVLGLAVLFLQWAIYGLVFHPFLSGILVG